MQNVFFRLDALISAIPPHSFVVRVNITKREEDEERYLAEHGLQVSLAGSFAGDLLEFLGKLEGVQLLQSSESGL